MLCNSKSITGFRLRATDGELGEVYDFCFDDQTWDIRYLVVKTGSWLNSRKVLISTAALRTPDWRSRSVPAALTCEQVRRSPDIDTAQTVTRRHELELHRHYAWPLYWGESFLAGGLAGLPPPAQEESPAELERLEQTHLQASRDILGYRLHAADGLIGQVEDFIVDDKPWAVRYLVADTGHWLSGRRVLISPHWAERVDWETSEVFVDLTRLAITKSPPFDPLLPVKEDYESALYDHYGRPRFENALPLASGGRGARR